MAKDIETLKQQALQIKNEVEDGANTADRVGGMFGDMLDYNEEKLTELSSKVGGVGYVTCYTAAGTAAKTITVTGLTALTTGIRLLVKMTNKNTASNAALNINSLGAKPLFYNNTRVSGDNAWEAGEVLDVFYDGTNFYSSNVQGGSGEGGNLILEWNTDAATTRKQVKQSDRKSLLQISYKDADGNPINEQYIGTTFTDTEWAKDSNWEKLAIQSQVDLIGHIANMAGAYNFDTVDTFNNISSPASTYLFNFENCKKGDILKLKVLNVTGYTGDETITAIIRTYIDGQSATTSQYFINNESIILNKEYEIELNFESNVLQYAVKKDNSNASSIFELKIERKYSSRKIDVEKINSDIETVQADVKNNVTKIEKWFGQAKICDYVIGKTISNTGSIGVNNKQIYTPAFLLTSKIIVHNNDNYKLVGIGRYNSSEMTKENFIGIVYSSNIVDDKFKIENGVIEINYVNEYIGFIYRRVDNEVVSDGDNPEVWVDYAPEISNNIYDELAKVKVYNREIFFSVEVHTSNPIIKSLQSASEFLEDTNVDKDYCILMLPEGHTSKSEPLKTIIFWHGSGETINETSSILTTTFVPTNYLCACGYAILAVNGLPKKLSDDNGLNYGRPCGNWMAIESIVKAWEYAKNYYNLSDDVFFLGESQGGQTALNALDYAGINVKAVVLDSPVLSIKYNQLAIYKVSPSNNLDFFFGFHEFENYSRDAVAGLDPWIRNISEDYEPYEYLKQGIETDDVLNTITSKRYIKAPLLLLQGDNDTACYPWVAQSFMKQLKNGGQFANMQLYTGVSHVVCTSAALPEVFSLSYNKRTYSIKQPMIDIARFLQKYGGYEPFAP